LKPDVFHTIFIVSFLSFIGIRLYYHRRARREGGRMNARDTRFSILIRLLLAIPLVGVLVGYMIRPGILGWAEIPLPGWASWLGAVLVLMSFPMLIWVHQALGANFNTVLGVRDRHSLVTHGPYHWVRHPMYGVLFLFMVGLLLLTGNLFIGGTLLAGLVVTVGTRVAKEEAILEEEYGEEYRMYKARTGRFLPRLSASN
jgi:protein-S-isoprenylcysteine O-methyltransferase Ste14